MTLLTLMTPNLKQAWGHKGRKGHFFLKYDKYIHARTVGILIPMVVVKIPALGIFATTIGISDTTIVLFQLIDKVLRDDVRRAVDVLRETMIEVLL